MALKGWWFNIDKLEPSQQEDPSKGWNKLTRVWSHDQELQ